MFAKPSRLFRRCAPVLLALSLTGCLSAQKKVAQKLPAVQTHWQSDLAIQAALPTKALDWPEALALIETNNLKLRAARVDITNAQELARQPFRDLIPSLNFRAGATRTFENIPATTVDDVTFNIDSFFNVPGVVNFDSRVFAGRLSVLRARAAARLTEREQSIALYKLFLESREQDEIEAELKSERVLADAVEQADEVGGQILRKEVESEQLSLKKSRDSLQAQAGELFANSQCRWIFQTNNLPDFPYGTEPLPLNDTNRVARLQRQLVAIELVRAWAQIHGIKLQYWPELTIFVGGPSVYQRVNGENQFWSASSATATANFFWTIDTRGYVAMQLRQTRREQELELARLQLDSQDLISRLLAAQRLVGELQEQIQQLDRLIAALDNIPQDLDVTSIVQSMESNRSLRLQRFKLRRDLAEVNTLFWFVDEQRWPAGT